MIAANELRIGNWVVYDGGLHEIDAIWSYAINLKYVAGGIELKKISPIPLTPEILDKCGFIKTGNEGECINCNRGILYIKFDHIGLVEYRIGELWFTTVHYLHQLQNLYWCLCGEELQITLYDTGE